MRVGEDQAHEHRARRQSPDRRGQTGGGQSGSSQTGTDTVPTATPAATTVPPSTAAPTTAATATPAAMPKTRPLPSGFLGLSMQYKAFEQYAGTNPTSVNPAFLNLIRQIAPNQSPVLRFGGDSTDWTWWPVPGMKQPPGVTYTLTPRWMQIARAMNTRPELAADPRRQPRGRQRQAGEDRGQRAGQRDRQAEHRRPGDRQRARAVLGVQLVQDGRRRRRQGPQRRELDRGRLLQAVQPVRHRDAGRNPGRGPGERLGDVSGRSSARSSRASRASSSPPFTPTRSSTAPARRS